MRSFLSIASSSGDVMPKFSSTLGGTSFALRWRLPILACPAIERGNGVVIAGDSFAVDDAGARAQPGERIDDQREAAGEVVAWTAVESHLHALLAGNDTEAVMLDLMQPIAAGRQFIGFGGKARRDEPGREATRQHVD